MLRGKNIENYKIKPEKAKDRGKERTWVKTVTYTVHSNPKVLVSTVKISFPTKLFKRNWHSG
jgi:hypothetical protein